MQGWTSVYTRQTSHHFPWLQRQRRNCTCRNLNRFGQHGCLSTKVDLGDERAHKYARSTAIKVKGYAQDLPKSPFVEKKTAAYRNRGRKPQANKHAGQEEGPAAPPRQEFLPPRGPKVTLNDSFKRAPFSTRFSMNPFAHALATPIREDSFTGAHLPTSCLVDFGLLDADTTTAEKTLLPLSLAEALIPRKKKNAALTGQEREIRARWAEEQMSISPTYSSSYVLNSSSAMSYIAGEKRPLSLVLSRRIRETINRGTLSDKQISWRGDMPEFLLSALRKVTVRKLSFFFRNKARGDNPGVLSSVEEELGLRKLDELDNLACVLRLKPVEGTESRTLQENHNDEASAIEETDAAFEGSTVPELDQVAYGAEADEPTSDYDPAAAVLKAPREPGMADIDRFHADHAWWPESDATHRRVRLLGPSLKSPLLHYPTVFYRRQRIPLYDLPTLLGDEYLADLIKDTVFVKSTHAVMAHSLGAVGAHQWLMKLQDYLARRKDELETTEHDT